MDLELTIPGCDFETEGDDFELHGPSRGHERPYLCFGRHFQNRGPVAWVFQNRGPPGIDTCWCGTAYRPCLPIPRNPSLNLVEVDPVGSEQFLDGWRL